MPCGQSRMSRGGKTTKIHTVADGLGNPIYFQLSAGNVLADKAYGTKEILDYIQN